MTKSFKENYADMNTPAKEVVEEITTDPIIITPVETSLPTPNTKIPMPFVKESRSDPIRVELTEEIANVLTEQREQSAKVLESVMKTNTKIANSITKLIKGTTETNTKLVEAILALTDKIEILEAKLEAIENLEIPTPIVNLQMPNTKIVKEVHRDKKTGLISHITESGAFDDSDEDN